MVMHEKAKIENETPKKSEKLAKKRKLSEDDGIVPEEQIKQTSDTEQNIPDTQEHGKMHKKRKRHYFNAIRAQMEFYFGDANLSKDRYLKKLILDDPFVPLEVFMTFNKMKTLCNAVEEISKSLSNSQLLELNESGDKVRRKTKILEERNVDEKTLYVESLPAIATHDWVREIFERFGPVSYVSLPKYAKSRKIKEFGFVEFEKEESIDKAMQAFKTFNGVLQIEETDPAELTSVKSFIKEQNEQIKEESDVQNTYEINKRKRKKCKSANKELEPQVKRIKKEEKSSEYETESATNTQSSVSSDTEVEENADKNSDVDVKSAKQETDASGEVENKQKQRKKKKSTKSLKEHKRDTELEAEAAYFELKILPKRDWKRLRNKYLNLQRQKVGELKRKAWRERNEQQQQQQTNETADDEHAENETKKSKSKLNAGMNMNFYGARDDEATSKAAKHNPALERVPLFNYEPGLIVEVTLLEPCTNLKEFKANMRQYPVVKYVDVKEGSMLAQLRLESPNAALQFVERMNSAEHGCKVLAGETETAYWQKIERDREAKLNKQIKLPQKRGREKIKKLITQHIRFGDEK